METYRHAIYRYSTGIGPNAIVDIPERAGQVASFKGEPLMHTLQNAEGKVALLREADRVSMQVEDAMRQIKTLGYNPRLGSNLTILKKRVELIRHLMSNYPINFVLRPDLELMYQIYVKNGPGLDLMISRVVDYNKVPGTYENVVKNSTRVTGGFNIFDKFGRKLNAQDKELLKKDKPTGILGLSGFGDTTVTLATVAGVLILVFVAYRVLFK